MDYLFYNWKFVHSDSLYPFCPVLPVPFPSSNHYSVLSIHIFVFGWFIYFAFCIPYMSEIKCYLFFYDLISFSVMPSRSIHVVENGKNSSFCLFVLVFLGPYPQHMEIPRPGVESELQPPA